jgi:uncharacterized protein (DUF2252 family)
MTNTGWAKDRHMICCAPCWPPTAHAEGRPPTLLDRFRLVDAAFKVVGVGSVGTRCLVMLLQDSYDQPLFLQLKEARRSVLEPYTQHASMAIRASGWCLASG